MKQPRRVKKTKKPARRKFWHPQFHVIRVDVFSADVALAINMGEKEVLERVVEHINKNLHRNKAREKVFLENLAAQMAGWDEDIHCAGLCISHRGGLVVLARLERGWFRKGVAILSHELTHATHYLLRDRRIPLNEYTEEIYTYLQDFLLKDALYRIYD